MNEQCPATHESLTCDQSRGHRSVTHHDPRGVLWVVPNTAHLYGRSRDGLTVTRHRETQVVAIHQQVAKIKREIELAAQCADDDEEE